jgi:hypothetical protein
VNHENRPRNTKKILDMLKKVEVSTAIILDFGTCSENLMSSPILMIFWCIRSHQISSIFALNVTGLCSLSRHPKQTDARYGFVSPNQKQKK